MKIYALLSWYDERPDWLSAVVGSISKLCDGIVAVDGAYFLFPDSLRHPTSGAAQAGTILETALSLDMSCTIHVPDGPWLGNEVAKRQAMLDLGIGKPMEDWYLIIDADEVLSDVPFDARERIEKTDRHAVEIRMWERDDGGTVHHMWPIRRLYRVLPEMKFGPAHYNITGVVDGERLYLSDSLDRPRVQTAALDMSDLRLEHRNRQRNRVRVERKEWYYRQRDELGIEREALANV